VTGAETARDALLPENLLGSMRAFDQATERQRARERKAPKKAPRQAGGRGWRREDLYKRGRAR